MDKIDICYAQHAHRMYTHLEKHPVEEDRPSRQTEEATGDEETDDRFDLATERLDKYVQNGRQQVEGEYHHPGEEGLPWLGRRCHLVAEIINTYRDAVASVTVREAAN